MEQTIVVGTWAFAAEPVRLAVRMMREGQSAEDCLESALNVAEEDVKYGPCQVGRGGPPNVEGEVELDAAIMSGNNLSFGAVTGLQGIARASSVARLVKDKSPHSMLTGQGAQDFAVRCGFDLHSTISTTQQERSQGEPQITHHEQNRTSGDNHSSHDTLAMIVLDTHGNVAAGVTTSGMRGKARGRVGDSALPGSGLYADNQVGAVCCSGDGDNIMKFCPSLLVMESMRQGVSPDLACQAVIQRIKTRLFPSPPFELAIIAVNMKGETGAASTVSEWKDPMSGHTYPGFPVVLARQGLEPEIQVASAQAGDAL